MRTYYSRFIRRDPDREPRDRGPNACERCGAPPPVRVRRSPPDSPRFAATLTKRNRVNHLLSKIKRDPLSLLTFLKTFPRCTTLAENVRKLGRVTSSRTGMDHPVVEGEGAYGDHVSATTVLHNPTGRQGLPQHVIGGISSGPAKRETWPEPIGNRIRRRKTKKKYRMAIQVRLRYCTASRYCFKRAGLPAAAVELCAQDQSSNSA